MPQEPKKRHSRQRQGKRRAHIRLTLSQTIKCSNCGETTRLHTVCAACGYYKGRQVLKGNKEKKSREAGSRSARQKSDENTT
ncbi:MAG: 50S ribosomal protein L32 [Candidatus Levybacteria bacterium]|nr:50S ribosomal protein L32 [Candidatus Levybacteria bacterium]